jgi:hypothetical protein
LPAEIRFQLRVGNVVAIFSTVAVLASSRVTRWFLATQST